MEQTGLENTAILIIDDEESLRLTFQLFLQRQGYSPVRTAASFEEALTAIADNHFDLIISDIVLEGNSGIDLLRRIREMGVQCPVVMVTGYPNVETASEAVRLGAFDYISKPVDKETLLKTARLALRQYRLESEKEKAEQENKQYQTLLETIFRSVSDAIITVDSELNIVTMNQAAASLLRELNPDNTERLNFNEFCHRNDFCSLKDDAEHVLKTGTEISEHRIECLTAGNSQKILSVCMSPFDDGGGNFSGVVVVIRDMTRIAPKKAGHRTRFHRFIGKSDVMQTVYTMIENVGKVDTTVLISGESGTGKELAAEALHEESHRKNRPLVKVDCTAIPEGLLESELFGHKKGSFTGADRDRMGRILQADGGTLFLDEIGEMCLDIQAKLLRFLESGEYQPVGSLKQRHANVRLVAATNADLRKKVENGSFREDLYYRLNIIPFHVPALRERSGDVELLIPEISKRLASEYQLPAPVYNKAAMDCLRRYSWPGNIRELRNLCERMLILFSGREIHDGNLPREIRHQQQSRWTFSLPDSGIKLDELEQELLQQALEKTNGNQSKAARILGLTRYAFMYRLKKYQLQ